MTTMTPAAARAIAATLAQPMPMQRQSACATAARSLTDAARAISSISLVVTAAT